MPNFEDYILRLLKNKLKEVRRNQIVSGDIPFECDFPQTIVLKNKKGATKPKERNHEFYLYSLADNIIEPMNKRVYGMYCNGSGNELESKMRALRSSSAMTYNLFGNHETVTLNGLSSKSIADGKYTVEFEKQLFTLDESKTSAPANLDAFLTNGDTVVACEMKMMEWFSTNNSNLKKAYINENYYKTCSQGNAFNAFLELASHLVDENGQIVIDDSIEEYKTFFNRYDCFQMFKHTLACYNHCAENKGEIKNLTLLNCVWEIKNINSIEDEKIRDKYKKISTEEHQEFDLFKKLLMPIKNLFKNELGVEFNVEYIPYYDMINSVANLSNDEKAYLDRYII